MPRKEEIVQTHKKFDRFEAVRRFCGRCVRLRFQRYKSQEQTEIHTEFL